MAEYEAPVFTSSHAHHLPYWAQQSQYQYARDLLESSDEPIEYDHDDRDYWDNSFFFPEDCSPPPKGGAKQPDYQLHLRAHSDNDLTMIPGLPDIKMLDAEALGDLLEDNLSPPEITSILVFATNGAIFAYASPLPTRQLRNLSATYGAAYTCYAKSASSGNLTGVNPASHPSSYVTAQSVSLGNVGSIVFELDDLVAVVTRIADKVLLAAVGPSKSHPTDDEVVVNGNAKTPAGPGGSGGSDGEGALETEPHTPRASATQTPTNGTPNHVSRNQSETPMQTDAHLETQYQIDRSSDLERLASLNLSASPAILLALESKSAALGRFLSQKLDDLESPEDF